MLHLCFIPGFHGSIEEVLELGGKLTDNLVVRLQLRRLLGWGQLSDVLQQSGVGDDLNQFLVGL